jgi:hypothetical protein
MYIVAPHSKFGQTLRKPFIKFICHSASYFTFLCEYITVGKVTAALTTGRCGARKGRELFFQNPQNVSSVHPTSYSVGGGVLLLLRHQGPGHMPQIHRSL